MNEPGEILSFVKAMASADRLRIVGLLSQGAKRAAEIAQALGMHPSDVNRHLEQLTGSGVVSEADGVYDLNEKAIESLARGQFEGKRPATTPCRWPNGVISARVGSDWAAAIRYLDRA